MSSISAPRSTTPAETTCCTSLSRRGAGGVVAAELVARSPADGHVLMLGDSGAMAINIALNPKVTYHPLRDFTLITALAAVPTVLVATPAVAATSLHDFV